MLKQTALVMGLMGLLMASLPIYALGQTGHRVTGEIAESYLSASAKQALADILDNQSLAEVSTYADQMRSKHDPFWQKVASPYHYVTIPDGKTYHQVGAPEKGDAVFALSLYTKQLKNPSSTKAEKALAIKMIVHLIGDLHQPLHVGTGLDRGGNDVRVKFFNRHTNLHVVWDSKMIDSTQLSFTELALWLNRTISKQDLKNWSDADPQVWIKESMELRNSIYPEDSDTPNLRYQYLYNNLPKLKLRLKQAGVRVAVYLNEVFEK